VLLVGFLFIVVIADARNHELELMNELISSSQDRQCTCYKPNIEARSCNHDCRKEAINITNSECVSVALIIDTGYLYISSRR
jgi:hypothetical protein